MLIMLEKTHLKKNKLKINYRFFSFTISPYLKILFLEYFLFYFLDITPHPYAQSKNFEKNIYVRRKLKNVEKEESRKIEIMFEFFYHLIRNTNL